MNKIIVKGIKLYAYHGCHEEEQRIGNNYEVDVIAETDLTKASNSDRLEDTVDYVEIYNSVKEQMATNSKLIEHVAKRIIDDLMVKIPAITKIKVSVAKLNPPIKGVAERVVAELEETRK